MQVKLRDCTFLSIYFSKVWYFEQFKERAHAKLSPNEKFKNEEYEEFIDGLKLIIQINFYAQDGRLQS